MKYLTLYDKKDNLILFLEGKFELKGKAILNNSYPLTLSDKEPVFTDIGGEIKRGASTCALATNKSVRTIKK